MVPEVVTQLTRTAVVQSDYKRPLWGGNRGTYLLWLHLGYVRDVGVPGFGATGFGIDPGTSRTPGDDPPSSPLPLTGAKRLFGSEDIPPVLPFLRRK